MTEVVNSQLNPLAIAFIPTNLELPEDEAIEQPIVNENETKTTREKKGKQNSNDQKSENKMDKKMAKKTDCQNDIWKDVIFFSSLTSMLNVFLKSSFFGKTNFNLIGGSQLPMLLKGLTDDDHKLVQKSQANITSKNFIEEEDECNCPPMFGWIVPPDFIGNPFKFKYECSKKYPHSPNCMVKQKSVDKLNYPDTKKSKWTLDQCYSEMKDIIADVYDTISMDLYPTEWEEKYLIKDFLDVSDEESDEERAESVFVTEKKFGVQTEADLIDDGEHPLLQPVPIAEEAVHEHIENVEKILERSLSPLPQLLDGFAFEQGAVCDPPCSVWCEFSPFALKNTFKKCIQKSDCINNKDYQQSSVMCRPVVKRSLSADDALMYDSLFQGLNHTSEVDSNDLLLLCRNNPLRYFRMKSSDRLIKRKYGSWDLTDQQLFTSSTKSNMWGKFDGADSLWQPLPECHTSKNYSQKLNKGRETKRQKQ